MMLLRHHRLHHQVQHQQLMHTTASQHQHEQQLPLATRQPGGRAAPQRRLYTASRQRCVACCAAQQRSNQKTEQQQPAAPSSSLGSTRGAPKPPSQEDDEGWGVFSWEAYQQPWAVPWGGGTVAATMAVWLLGFAATAFLAMPAAYSAAVGTPLTELSPAQQADFALWSEIAECVVTFGIVGSVAAKYGPQVSEQQLFSFSLAQPFKRGTGWLAWGLIGAAAAPLVVGAAALGLSAVGYDAATQGGRGTVDGVAGMIAIDLPTYARLLSVTGVLAPLLEETLFRGFLLTSLTKVMPNWAAVLASSTAFGLAHLSVRDLPVLIALGCWLGAIYCRSRNLLTPILVHGAWNSTVLTLLFWLQANYPGGVEKLLRENAL